MDLAPSAGTVKYPEQSTLLLFGIGKPAREQFFPHG